MHCGLGRTSRGTQKNSVRGRDTSTRKFNGKNSFRTALEDSEEPSITWRNFNRRQTYEHLRKSEVGLLAQIELAFLIQRPGSRCAFLTLLSLEPENSLRIVSLPLQCPDNTNFSGSSAQVNMDSLRLFYTPPINPLKVIQPKEQQGSLLAGSYCGKSFMNRSFAGSNVRHQFRNITLAYEATKWNELSRESCQKSLTCSSSSNTIENSSNAINLSDTGSGGEKVDNVKRNSRKKSRKKGKQGKKHSSASSSTEADALSVECANGSSAPETCGNNDGSGSVSSSTALEVSLSGAKNESPKPCIPCHDELEVDIPSVGNLGHQSVHKDAEFSIFDGVGRIPRTQLSDCNDLYTKGYSDMHNSFVLDSISVGSNFDDNTIDGHDEKHAEKDIRGVDFSEPSGFSSRMGSCQSMSNDVIDTYDNTEGMRHGIQDCNSNGMQSVVLSKRSKQHKTEQRSSNFFKFRSTGNLHHRSGKENNHSVWQKVQKNDCKCELKKVSSVYSQNDLTLTEASLPKTSCTAVNVNVFPKREDKIQQKDMVSKELKIKGGLASKQVFYARKGAHANFPGSDGCLKSGVEQNDMSDVLSQVTDNKGSSLVSRSCSQPSCPRVGFQSSKEGSMTSESVHSMQLCPNEVDRLEGVHNSFSGMKTQISGNRDTAMQKISDSLGESNLLPVQSPPIYLPHLLCKAGIQAQKDALLAESCRENPSSGSLKHKWVPIELKDPVTGSTSSSSHDHSDEPAAKRWTPKDTAKGNTQNISSEAVVCLGQSSGDITCSSDKTEDMLPKLGYQDASTIDALKDKLSAAKCMNFESKDLNAVEVDSNRILEAVNNACRAQLASEAVQMVTGGPIAEFERLLYYSSPVVHESPKFIRCQTCSRNQVGGLPVCRHETTNITLGCLWQWYQISGSYGLEIRAEEFGNSKGLGADRFAFHGYFVPYLSAVQLFRSCRSESVDTSTLPCSTEVLVEKSKKTSNLGHLPIFSILFPRPRKENTITPPLVNEPCILDQSSAPAKDVPVQLTDTTDTPVQLTDTTGSSDLELLFEYFESEQPQLRRPLYDKIKELVRGDRPSDSNVYGDPTNLDSINLNDLHSRSWFSVAWYPIYRIPHGNLRAAFLTYHSLGHLVRRSANFESPSADECIVSPVVGLQSYNAQDECWFQPRQSALRQTTVTPGPVLNSYRGVLEERLKTLEETASLMARAVVKKGSMTSVNRHPDYEFFLSRRR